MNYETRLVPNSGDGREFDLSSNDELESNKDLAAQLKSDREHFNKEIETKFATLKETAADLLAVYQKEFELLRNQIIIAEQHKDTTTKERLVEERKNLKREMEVWNKSFLEDLKTL